MAQKKQHSKSKEIRSKGGGGSSIGTLSYHLTVDKKTSIGHSRNSRPIGKNDKRMYKRYRGQGG